MKHRAALILLPLLTLLSTHSHCALSDPTAPLNNSLNQQDTSTQDSGWLLHSTLISQGRRIALINGHSVREGDHVGNARVVSIKPAEVQLISNQRRITLRLIDKPLQTKTVKP